MSVKNEHNRKFVATAHFSISLIFCHKTHNYTRKSSMKFFLKKYFLFLRNLRFCAKPLISQFRCLKSDPGMIALFTKKKQSLETNCPIILFYGFLTFICVILEMFALNKIFKVILFRTTVILTR